MGGRLARTKLTEEEFLAGFGESERVAHELLARARGAGWLQRIGSAEASLRQWEHGPHTFYVFVSAAYTFGPYARIWCASAELRDRLAALLKERHPAERVVAKGESVQVFFGPGASLGGLFGLLEDLGPASRSA